VKLGEVLFARSIEPTTSNARPPAGRVSVDETHRKGLTNRRETEADILLPILLPRRLAIYEKFAYKPVAMKFLEVAT